ncbi:hypothetical protein [Cryptosporangium aurantiacum]|uniref:Roadblock/LAMTOR2 domain-containing protein n=1 Tax=Cryptosporangium aurantiacum TaxID=134849 RepID=A0A1M7QFC5_9ACTN|nr:hypothetical protein [Cryptosporangium aurantiacum]SHN29630.1 hypothetical protein SAMN05443668_104594 [Cryptosporangium aurantiacum]
MPGIDESLQRAMAITGARGANLVDFTSGLVVGTVGEWPHGGSEAAAAGATEVVRAARDNSAFVGPERSVGQAGETERWEDIVLTAQGRYDLLRFVHTAFDGRFFLHLWLDRNQSNLAMARLELRRLADELVLQ